MSKRFCHTLLPLLMLLLPMSAGAQKDSLSFVYGTKFEYNFDNREFDRGGNEYTRSMTIHAARLTPLAGFKVSDGRFKHTVTAGVDLLKDMGDEKVFGKDVVGELLANYTLDADFGDTKVSTVAGIFPRSASGGKWSQAFISDSLALYDNNLEGLLIRVSRPRSYYEVGLDWMGQFGTSRKERFMIFSYGETHPLDFLSAGWNLAVYHYAGSKQARGVVDNILAEPWLRADLVGAGSSLLSAQIGWLQTFQRDRMYDLGTCNRGSAELVLTAQKKSIGVQSRSFFGGNMQPMYDGLDGGGNKYGSKLYYGSHFYASDSAYHRIEAYWHPHIGSFVDLSLSAVFHFAGGYQGCQQKFSLLFDLEKVCKR